MIRLCSATWLRSLLGLVSGGAGPLKVPDEAGEAEGSEEDHADRALEDG